MLDTLLPPTATDLAKALDVLEERLFNLPVEAISKTPEGVPEELLAHLAWELSVDAWSDAWTVERKRHMLAIAEDVHRYKGTPYAIKRVLEPFPVQTELLEWWQPGGSGVAGTFTVTAYFDYTTGGPEEVFSPDMFADITQVVRSVSPVSRKFDLQAAVLHSASIYGAAIAKTHIVAIADYAVPPPPVLTAAVKAGVVPVGHIRAVAPPA